MGNDHDPEMVGSSFVVGTNDSDSFCAMGVRGQCRNARTPEGGILLEGLGITAITK